MNSSGLDIKRKTDAFFTKNTRLILDPQLLTAGGNKEQYFCL